MAPVSTAATETAEPTGRKPRGRGITSLEVLCVVLLLAILFQGQIASMLTDERIRTASTVFISVCIQAMPFLVLGVLISGAIAAFVSPERLRKLLPGNQAVAVPVAGLAGLALPGCECSAVPVSGRLMQQGVRPAVALTFLLAAPAVNPIVLGSTAVAFQGEPLMVVARFAGSLATAVVMGWLWVRFGKTEWIAERALRRYERPAGVSRWGVFAETARHDLVEAGGFLVIGGIIAAVLKVTASDFFSSLSGQIVLGVLVMAVAAVVMALCSEADALVAASMSALPLLPRLVFLVVGPAVDVKLIALQAGTFGRKFVLRFAPLTFLVAILCGVGAFLLVFGEVR